MSEELLRLAPTTESEAKCNGEDVFDLYSSDYAAHAGFDTGEGIGGIAYVDEACSPNPNIPNETLFTQVAHSFNLFYSIIPLLSWHRPAP